MYVHNMSKMVYNTCKANNFRKELVKIKVCLWNTDYAPGSNKV